MISFHTQNDFQLSNEKEVATWIETVIKDRGFNLGEISYVFCSDSYLLELNQKFLDHDTLTDIISFDETMGKLISGEIYISTDRVADNAKTYEETFLNELHRVIIHGVLHFCGIKDKSEAEVLEMRKAEEDSLAIRHFA